MGLRLTIVLSLIVSVLAKLVIIAMDKGTIKRASRVMPPIVCSIIGWTCCTITAALLVVQIVKEASVAIKITTIGAAVFAVLFLTISYSLTIEYDKKGFTVRKFFIKKQYKYEDIDSVIKKAGGGYTLRIKGKKTMVDEIMSGRFEFLHFADKRYNAINGFFIPEESPKLFNGHILDPYSFLFLGLIIPLGMTLVTVLNAKAKPINYPDNLIQTEAAIISVEKDFFITYLTIPDGEIYLPDVPDKEKLLNELTPEKDLVLYIEPWENRNEDDPPTVWAISDTDGNYYFTIEDSYKAIMRDTKLIQSVLIVLAVLSWPCFFWFCYIMSNPAKHPKLIKLMIKEEYIKW